MADVKMLSDVPDGRNSTSICRQNLKKPFLKSNWSKHLLKKLHNFIVEW